MFIFIRRNKKTLVQQGYFQCPKCYTRRAASFYQTSNGWYLFGVIPMWMTDAMSHDFECHECHELFNDNGDWPFAFDENPKPRTWECRQCGEHNSPERFHCSNCRSHV